MKLDKKALEAAEDALWHNSPPGSEINLAPAIRAYLDDADLVARSDLLFQQKLRFDMLQERDEARCHAADNGKMIAALRGALEELLRWHRNDGDDTNEPPSAFIEQARAVLEETAPPSTQEPTVGEDDTPVQRSTTAELQKSRLE